MASRGMCMSHWQWLVLGLLAVLALQAVGVQGACGDAEEEVEDYYYDMYVDNEFVESLEVRTSTLCIAAVLIVLSICFEVCKEKVEETTGEEMEPIVEHLWQELTVLGFLSVLTFLVTYLGLLHPLSCAIFDEEEKLDEMVEDVHMLLFAVMVVFICYCLLLVRLGERVRKAWKKEEQACRHPARVEAAYFEALDKLANRPALLYRLFRSVDPNRKKVEQMFYYLARHEFIHPRDGTKRLPKHFDFGAYLSLIMGEMLGDLVEISPAIWLFLFLFFCFCWLFTFLPVNAVIPFFITFGWVLLLFFYIIMRKLELIRLDVLPVLRRDGDEILINEQKTLEHDLSHVFDDPRFLRLPLRRRGPILRWWLGAPANKHQMLFWFDRRGKHFIVFSVRFLVILSAVYLAGMLPMIFLAPSWYWILAILPLSLAPIMIGGYVIVPQIIKRWVLVCNIEMMKRPEIIARVIRQQKTQSSLRLLKVIHIMKFATRKERKVRTAGRRKEISSHRRKEMEEAFKLFDTDNSGNISAEELREVFETLGHVLTELEAVELVESLDTNGDGELSFEEFLDYFEEDMNDFECSTEEMVESMFSIFDGDTSGSISVDEFRATIMKLGTSLTEEDVQAIVDEIDDDDDGRVSLEEFEELVHKHLVEAHHHH